VLDVPGENTASHVTNAELKRNRNALLWFLEQAASVDG
jgi:hypothetical protein